MRVHAAGGRRVGDGRREHAQHRLRRRGSDADCDSHIVRGRVRVLKRGVGKRALSEREQHRSRRAASRRRVLVRARVAEELEALEDKKKRRAQRVANMLLDQMEVRYAKRTAVMTSKAK